VLCKVYSNRLPIFLTSALLNAINAIILLPVIFFFHTEPLHVNLTSCFILFVIGLSSRLFYDFWSTGVTRVDGIMSSLSTAVMPVATVILAWLILGEHLTSTQLVDMTLVISSIILYARR